MLGIMCDVCDVGDVVENHRKKTIYIVRSGTAGEHRNSIHEYYRLANLRS